MLYEEQYARDKARRISQKTVNVGGQTSLYSYSYDTAGRLTDVMKDGASAGHFEYDANGNRTLAYGIAASYDDQDRLVDFGGAQYSYTANGELKQIAAGSNVTEYNYDVFGNLAHAVLPDGSTLNYLVDGRNRRIGKKVNGTLTQGFLYQNQLEPAAELDGQGNVVARFVYAGKANVPEYMVKNNITYRIVTDQLGSVRLVVDSATGQVAQRIDYDEWGNVQSDSNPGFQPFGFAGGLYDQHSGLVRFGTRDYDAKTARWTVKDPIGFAGGDTSLYNYVSGDPINWIDPSGLMSLICGGDDDDELKKLIRERQSIVSRNIDMSSAARGGGMRSPVIKNAPKSTLPRGPGGEYTPHPDAVGPHSTIGTRVGSDGQPYRQGATFDGDGNFRGRTDATDHGSPHRPGHVQGSRIKTQEFSMM